MEANSFFLLKSEIEKVFGKRILFSGDCQHLGNEIERTTNIKISFNTLRRFFNLLKAANQPSIYTLNALANYCGFSSFDNFIISKQQNTVTEFHEQHQTILSFLTLFFRQIHVCERNDTTYLSLVEQTILHLEQFPFIIDRFQREIAKTKNGQSFYFEQFVFVDKLNFYYGTGLQYYLKEKKTTEAQLFGHSLLCYRSWLIRNDKGVEDHYNKVMEERLNGSEQLKSFAVYALFFSTKLYHARVFALNEQPILLEIRQFYLLMRDFKERNRGSNCFEVILAECLILISRYEEALFYLEEVVKEVKKNSPAYVDSALYENVCLLKAIAFAKTGKKSKAYELLQNINPLKFSFLNKKFLSILYLLLKQIFKNKHEEQEQIQQLIRETGFVRLSAGLPDVRASANRV